MKVNTLEWNIQLWTDNRMCYLPHVTRYSFIKNKKRESRNRHRAKTSHYLKFTAPKASLFICIKDFFLLAKHCCVLYLDACKKFLESNTCKYEKIIYGLVAESKTCSISIRSSLARCSLKISKTIY